MSLPYFPLFPTDFEADTSHLSMAEDGAYNRLLRLCWMAPGCTLPADETWIMRRMRARTDDEIEAVRAVLGEFFTVANGRLGNPRLTREYEKARAFNEKQRENGKKGGRPANALKTKETGGRFGLAKKSQPEPYPYRDTNVSLNPPTPRSRGAEKDPPEFGAFWEVYPRKVAKGAARKAWAKAIRTVDPQTIIAAASRVEHRGEYTPHPSTWLNGERWADAPEAPHGSRSGRPTDGQNLIDAGARAAARFRSERGDGGDGGGGPRMDRGSCYDAAGAQFPYIGPGTPQRCGDVRLDRGAVDLPSLGDQGGDPRLEPDGWRGEAYPRPYLQAVRG